MLSNDKYIDKIAKNEIYIIIKRVLSSVIVVIIIIIIIIVVPSRASMLVAWESKSS